MFILTFSFVCLYNKMLLMPTPPLTHTIVNGNVESVKENCSIADLKPVCFCYREPGRQPYAPSPSLTT